MSSFWSNLAGSVSGYFRLGLTGPRLKNSSGTLELRNAGDSAYASAKLNQLETTESIIQAASKYHNWGSTVGSSGYGFRDNSGVIEYKDSGGSWAGFASLIPPRVNRILNGGMRVAQISTNYVDGWHHDANIGGWVTDTQETDAPSGTSITHSRKVTIGGTDTSIGAFDRAEIRTSIEGYDIVDLIGNTFTIFFWVKSSKTGTFCLALANASDAYSYITEYTIGTANTWELKTITISGGITTSGTWEKTTGAGLKLRFILAMGSSWHNSAGSWISGDYRSTSSQVNLFDTVNATFFITGADLVLGSSAPTFRNLPYEQELEKCRRRLPGFISSTQDFGGFSYSTTQSVILVPFPVSTRVKPTGLIYSNTSHMTLQNGSAATGTVQTISFSHASTENAAVLLTTTAGSPTLAADGPIRAYSNTTSFYLFFTGAEI